MTGGRNIKTRRSGQAMIEFLLGLVGIIFLMLGLHQMALIVHEDFDSLIGSRQEVAEIVARSGGGSASFPDSGVYRPAGQFYGTLLGNILYQEGYIQTLEAFQRSDRNDGFEPVTADPLSRMIGVRGGSNIEVESSLMRKLIGDSIRIDNQVWMPPWDDLLYDNL